jgi:hypothetical protein
MDVLECSGSYRDIGRATGEALREKIAHHLSIFPGRTEEQERDWQRRLPAFLHSMEVHMPEVLEEIRGTAEGADRPVEDIYRLNFPLYNNELDMDGGQGCTNVGFIGGPDGAVLGKNNDMADPVGSPKARQYVLRIAKPPSGIPTATITFCGTVATLDGMNAEGVVSGHSSVGSVYQQSDHYAIIRLWGYVGLLRSRSAAEFVRHMTDRPLRGKGYAVLCTDAKGELCSLEAPCPVVQVRRPESANGMNAVNYYQLPALTSADRRKPEGRENAEGRSRVLNGVLAEGGAYDVSRMQQTLRLHSTPSICRHGGENISHTTFSMIGVPKRGQLLYLESNPCEDEYATYQF